MRILYIFILSLFLSPLLQGAEIVDPITENAIDQVNYLIERNKSIDGGTLNEKKWFIYFLGRTVEDLESYILHTSSYGNDSEQYLERLNAELTIINTSDSAAMYVAMTDYNTPIVVPLLPVGSTIQEKMASLKSIVYDEASIENVINPDINPENIQIALDGFENYKKYFTKITNEIYESSNLQSNNPGKKIILPMQVFHKVHINNIPKTYYSSTIKVSSLNENEKEVFDEVRAALVAAPYGTKPHQKSLARTVEAYKLYLNGNYELFIEGGYRKEIAINGTLSERTDDPNRPRDDTFDINKNILDLAGMFTESEKDELFEKIDFDRVVLEGMSIKIVLTDSSTPTNLLDNVQNYTVKNDQYIIWVHLNKGTNGESDSVIVKNLIGKSNFDATLKYSLSHWSERMWDNLALNTSDDTVALLKGSLIQAYVLADIASNLLGGLQIPEKYWNPNCSEYPDAMQYVTQALAVSTGDLSVVFTADIAQMQFAFKCGIWNGLVDEVKGIADLGKLAAEYFLVPDKARKFDEALRSLTFEAVWNAFQAAHGFGDIQYPASCGTVDIDSYDSFHLSHQLGKDVIFVASFFVGIGEIHALATTGKLPKVAVVAANMTTDAIRLIKKIPDALASILKKLPSGISRNITSGFLVYRLNSVQLFKLTDEAVFFNITRLNNGTVIRNIDNEPIIFQNIAYLDEADGVVKNGTFELVEREGVAGLRLANAGADLLPAFKSRLSSRLSNYPGFTLAHSDAEIIAIIQKGKSLNLADDVIDDFLLVSCRNSKTIHATDLKAQMDNWVNVVQQRGYPYKFNDLGQFNQFSNDLKNELSNVGVSNLDVRIQGSSLRTPNAGDVDLVAIVTQSEFDNFIKVKYNGNITKNGVNIDISNMTTSDLKNLADDIVLNSTQYTRKNLDDFAFTVNSQIINAKGSKNIIPNLKAKRDLLISNYPNLNIENIAIQPIGSKFDLKPFIKL